MVLVRPGGWPLLHTRSPGGHAAAAAGAGTPGPQEPKCGANRRPPAPVALLPMHDRKARVQRHCSGGRYAARLCNSLDPHPCI